jgi:dienelactone hydrolase
VKNAYAILALLSLLLVSPCLRADDAITRSSKLPATTPWDLQSLSRPPNFEWVDDRSPARSMFYSGACYGGKPTRVFAYYASPGTLTGDESHDQDLPAVVLIHGGGGTAFREWVELWAKRGYAAIAMDLAGHRPIDGENAHDGRNRTRLDDGGPNQSDDEKFGSVDKPPGEQWTYHAVANVALAHSLIRSFKGIDAKRTAVTGISWGGYLTCIVAGVDNRFATAVPVYGCGFLHQNSVWLGRFADMQPEQRDRWVKLWDPSRYLPAVSMPILFVNGTNDFAYPLDSYMKSFDSVPGPKQLCVMVNMPHGHQAGWAPSEIGLFVDQYLLETKPLPALGQLVVKDGEASLSWEGPLKLTAAMMHHTTDATEFDKRQWTSTEATIDGQSVIASSPPANATAWFFTVQDERGAVVSSRVMLPLDRR